MLNIDNLREFYFKCFEADFLELIDDCKLINDEIYPGIISYEKSNTKFGTITLYHIDEEENKIQYTIWFKETFIIYHDISTKKLKEFLQLMTIKHINSDYIVC